MKRGFVGGIKMLVTILFGLALFLIIMPYFNNLLALYLPQQDRHSVDTFNTINALIGNVLRAPTAYASDNYVGPFNRDYALIGYDKKWDDTIDHIQSYGGKTYSLPKPEICKGNACICLYQAPYGGDFGEANLVDCAGYNGNIVFSGILNGKYARGNTATIIRGIKREEYTHNNKITNDIEYEYLYMNGLNKFLNTNVEKYIAEDTIHIFITPAKPLFIGTQKKNRIYKCCYRNKREELVFIKVFRVFLNI